MAYCSIYPHFDRSRPNLPKGLRKLHCKNYVDLYQNRKAEPKGVVPKFKGQRQWTALDEEKLFQQQDHKYYKQGRAYLLANYPDTNIEALAKIPIHQEEMRNEVRRTQPKFTKWHWIKADYTAKNGVAIPESSRFHIRIGGVTIDIPIIRHILHFIAKLFNTRPIEEVNWEVMKEALCYDLYEAIGCGGKGKSAKAAVIVSVYPDGKPRLLLDSTEARGPDGEKPHDFRDQIRCPEKTFYYPQGRLDRNTVTIDGKQYPLDEEDIAQMYASMLFLGDWDKVGARGDNLLFYIDQKSGKARLLNIDPGRAMESSDSVGWTSMLRQRNIGSDGKIIYPSRFHPFVGRLANFTLLSDTKLTQRIEALQQIAARRKAALQVIDDYHEALREKIDGTVENLDELKRLLEARFDYLDEVLEPYKNVSNDQLAFLEQLEQMTSETRTTISDGEEQVRLSNAEVVSGTRREWRIKEDEYVFEGNSKECKEVEDRLRTLQEHCIISNKGCRVTVVQKNNREGIEDTEDTQRIDFLDTKAP